MAAFPAPEYYLNEYAVRDAIRQAFQFNVIHPASGNKIDFILAKANAWDIQRQSRGRRIRLLPDREVMVAAPEDVIIGKLWYYSEGGGDRHLRDIAGILRVSGEGIDRLEVERWARQLGYLDIWNQVFFKADMPDSPPGRS